MVTVLEIISLLINFMSFLRCAGHTGDVHRLHHILMTFIHLHHVTLCEMIHLYLGIRSLYRTQSIIF